MFTLKELSAAKGVPVVTLRYWIAKKRLKAYQNVDRFRSNDWYVSEEDWLEVPTYIRNRYITIQVIKKV